MSQIAIDVRGLSKRYRIGRSQTYRTLRETLVNLARAPFKHLGMLAHPESADGDRAFWALKDVRFSVNRGEVVGIIGRNGAGKSTLLKILSRITEPTAGEVEISGRVGSLLEVGTGFHPELTGRENVFLNGAILGMTRREIAAKFDEIVAFAETEKFLDTPVKHYSSGMYTRLAFAVAAHLDPEILIIDEVLAVGDAAFQKKCLGKMSDVARQGRTVLFVSHNMAAIQQLTHRCVLLERGVVTRQGDTADVLAYYMNSAMDRDTIVYDCSKARRPYATLAREVEFLEVALLDQPTKMIAAEAPISLAITVRGNQAAPRFRISATILQIDGTPVGSFFSRDDLSAAGAVVTLRLDLPDHRLAPGMYQLAMATGTGTNEDSHVDFDIITDILQFEVLPPMVDGANRATWSRGWGAVRLPAPIVTQMSNPPASGALPA